MTNTSQNTKIKVWHYWVAFTWDNPDQLTSGAGSMPVTLRAPITSVPLVDQVAAYIVGHQPAGCRVAVSTWTLMREDTADA